MPHTLCAVCHRAVDLGESPLAIMTRKRRDIFTSKADARQRWGASEAFSRWNSAALDAYVEHGTTAPAADTGAVELRCRKETEAAIYSTGSLEATRALPSVTADTIVVAGELSTTRLPYFGGPDGDEIMLPDSAVDGFRQVADSMPHATFHVAPGAGHFYCMVHQLCAVCCMHDSLLTNLCWL